MAPGFQKYALVLALLTTGSLAATGCSRGGGSKGGFAAAAVTSATPAGTTSGTTGGVTSSTTPTGPGVDIISVQFEDVDKDGKASKGDRIRVGFAGNLVFDTQTVDANKEFTTTVQGDTFGTGALALPDGAANTAVIVLGDAPKLRISDKFDAARTAAGEPSGLDVSSSPSGNLHHNIDRGPIRPNGGKDIEGSLKVGFAASANMVAPHGGCEAVTLDDGRVLVVGGLKGPNNMAEDAELYDPLTNQFTQVRDLSGPEKGRMMNDKIVVRRINHRATKLQDGRVLVTGGYGYQKKGGILGFLGFGKEKLETLDVAHIFDPKTNTFAKADGMKNDRHSHQATLLADGRVLLTGGYSDSWWSRNKTEAPFEAFNPKTNKFEQYTHWLILTNKTVEDRQNHSATALDNGARVLLAGGEHWEGGWFHWFGKNTLKMNKSSEVITASKNTSVKSGDMKRARRRQASTLLTNNEVLVAGGDDDKAIVPTLETWNPNTNAWTDRGALKFPRTNARIATFANETLIIGGFGMVGQKGGEIADVEAFDVSTGQVTAPYKLVQARNGAAVATLKDGRIMVIGGFSGTQKDVSGVDGQALATTEIFSKP